MLLESLSNVAFGQEMNQEKFFDKNLENFPYVISA